MHNSTASGEQMSSYSLMDPSSTSSGNSGGCTLPDATHGENALPARRQQLETLLEKTDEDECFVHSGAQFSNSDITFDSAYSPADVWQNSTLQASRNGHNDLVTSRPAGINWLQLQTSQYRPILGCCRNYGTFYCFTYNQLRIISINSVTTIGHLVLMV